jgi:hypothetical protein
MSQKYSNPKINKALIPQINNSPTTVDTVIAACNNDVELAEFFVEWLNNGKNAMLAYKKTHPDVTEGSAAVLGSRWLSRVNKSALLEAYGLNVDKYLTQLKEGVEADKWNDFTGDREPDHRARKPYHDKLGQLIGMETKEEVKPQINIQNIIGNWLSGGSKSDDTESK